MNPEIKAKWVAALRSGEYKQATGRLRVDDSFCCLGVLCDLHAKFTGTVWWQNENRQFEYKGQRQILPEPVIEWAAIPHEFGDNIYLHHKRICLSAENDEGVSFAEIADIIEREL